MEGIVKDIIDKVRAEGDDALRFYNAKFDGCTVQDLKVSEEEIEEAFRNIDKELLGSIERAAENITYFHKKQLENSWFEQKEDGTTLGMLIQPLRNVGIYVPGGAGGKTPLPSSVLMNVVPAKVAGVEEGSAKARIVAARSAADTPVEQPSSLSMVTVKGVPSIEVLSET